MNSSSTKLLIFLLLSFALTGCMSDFNSKFSQWRGDEENQNRLAKMYAMALPLCDGKEIESHKTCVANVRKEYANRFADRYKAYYTASSAESLLATAIVVSYVADQIASSGSSSASKTSKASSSVRKTRLCRTHKLSQSHSISLSSFTVIPVTCS
jgi:hypothetical protein